MNALSIKLQTAMRYCMVYGLSDFFPLYIVNEYPKSGGTWLGQMLGRALNIPFPRNTFPKFRSSIMHGHYVNPWGMKNVVILWRDGRDMIVSWYHHCLFVNESGWNAPVVNKLRSRLQFSDYSDVRGNLPRFIEYCFTRHQTMRFSWTDFVNNWHGRDRVIYVRYEDLHRDGVGELQRIVKELTGKSLNAQQSAEIVDEFSFARQARRKPGQENKNSFLRKGIVGDWRNQFTPEACQVFDRFAGDTLIKLGYEQNRNWVSNSLSAKII